jgi:hypothetical protein
MSIQTDTTFDLDSFAQAIEERDAARQVAAYADEAEVTVIDKLATPSAPRVLRGTAAIQEYIEDVCGRDMTHRVSDRVTSAEGAAFFLSCRYPDGTAVGCAAVLTLRDGLIVREVTVSAWDE